MISALVLALNPSIDAEWRVDRVLWEEKNNVHSERRWAGGKGINVARWLQHLGGNPLLLLPLGGQAGLELAGYLRAEKLPADIVRLREATRVNVILTTKEGRQMRFNPPGPKLSSQEWQAVFKRVNQNLKRLQPLPQAGTVYRPAGQMRNRTRTGLLILSGSLPRGVPVRAYARLIRLARVHGVETLLDCDGPVLAAAVNARPFLVKPNEHELTQWWGKPLKSEADTVRAACALSVRTGGWVLVSRGSRRSILVNIAAGYRGFARPRHVKPRNTVGAGDALLAGVAWEILTGHEPAEWLRQGVAVGTRATQLLPGKMP